MKKAIVLFFVFVTVLKVYSQENPSKVDVGDKAFDFIGLDENEKK
jgi:hypothetical protein